MKNTVKTDLQNIMQNKHFRYLNYILLQMPVKGAKGLVLRFRIKSSPEKGHEERIVQDTRTQVWHLSLPPNIKYPSIIEIEILQPLSSKHVDITTLNAYKNEPWFYSKTLTFLLCDFWIFEIIKSIRQMY